MSELNPVNQSLEAVKQSLPAFVPSERMSLPQILNLMTQVDEGLINASLDDMKWLMNQAELKVDAYKHVKDQLEEVESRLDKKVKEFTKAKKVVAKQLKRLSELMTHSLQKNGFTKFKGEEYRVSLVCNSRTTITKREPTAMDVVNHPQYVRTSYEWDKNALAKGLKDGCEFAASVAEIKEKMNPKFDVNKGIADD